MKGRTMKPRTAWMLIALCSLAVAMPDAALSAKAGAKVECIDPAGIKKLVQDSEGLIIVGMASWCFPCRQELPILVKLYNKYKDRGLKVVGISVDMSGPSAIEPVVEEEHVNFPVYWGGEPAIKELEMTRLPMLLFLKKGTVVERVIGQEPEQLLEEKIHELLK